MLELRVDAAELIARIENVPFSRWHTKARVIVAGAFAAMRMIETRARRLEEIAP